MTWGVSVYPFSSSFSTCWVSAVCQGLSQMPDAQTPSWPLFCSTLTCLYPKDFVLSCLSSLFRFCCLENTDKHSQLSINWHLSALSTGTLGQQLKSWLFSSRSHCHIFLSPDWNIWNHFDFSLPGNPVANPNQPPDALHLGHTCKDLSESKASLPRSSHDT